MVLLPSTREGGFKNVRAYLEHLDTMYESRIEQRRPEEILLEE